MNWLLLLIYLHLAWCQPDTQPGEKILLMKKRKLRGDTLASPDTPSHFCQYLQDTNIYVDKTLLIKTLIEDLHDPVVIITGPEQWGKSLNLLLLSFFWETELSETGTVLPQSNTFAYQFFVRGRNFERPPLISQHTKIVDQHLAKHPIIRLDYGQVEADDFDRFYDNFRLYTCSPFTLYSYTIDSFLKNKTNVRGVPIPEDKDKLEKFHSLEKLCGDTEEKNPTLLQNSVSIFSELLAYLYETKVIVLIDNYDAFLQKIYEGYYPPMASIQISRIEDYYRIFLQKSTTNNSHIHRSIFTGILPLSFDFGTDSNKVKYYSVTHTKLHPYYGFSQEELDSIMEYAKIPETLANEVRAFYDGYEVEDSSTTVYNPWSIVTFLECRNVTYYWAPINNPLEFAYKVFKNSRYQNTVKKLRRYQCLPVNRSLSQVPPLKDLRLLKTLKTNQDKLAENTTIEYLFFWYLNAAGYLTVDYANGGCVKLPNFELHGFAHYTLFRVELVYRYQPETAEALIRVLEEDKHAPVDALVRGFKNITDYDGNTPPDDFRFRFFDVLQTVVKTDSKYNATMELPLKTSKHNSFQPSMLISNGNTTVVIDIRKHKSYNNLKDDMLHLWLYCDAYFNAFPRTQLLKLIVVNTCKNGTVQYVDFSYPQISDIPTYGTVKQFEVDFRSLE